MDQDSWQQLLKLAPELARMVRCDWGDTLELQGNDWVHCEEQALDRVEIHDGGVSRQFQLCRPHMDHVLTLTDPHPEDVASHDSD